jgi:hypothetical protein
MEDIKLSEKEERLVRELCLISWELCERMREEKCTGEHLRLFIKQTNEKIDMLEKKIKYQQILQD